MKNIKITAAVMMAIATVLIVSAYNYDDDYSMPAPSGRLGTAVRDTVSVAAQTAQGVVDVAADAAKETASIVTTGERRNPEDIKREKREKRRREKERKKEEKKGKKRAEKK